MEYTLYGSYLHYSVYISSDPSFILEDLRLNEYSGNTFSLLKVFIARDSTT
jgi:hypothetical protein